MARAVGLWQTAPQDFRYLALNGMRVDRSWARPGQDYLNIYDDTATNERTVEHRILPPEGVEQRRIPHARPRQLAVGPGFAVHPHGPAPHAARSPCA